MACDRLVFNACVKGADLNMFYSQKKICYRCCENIFRRATDEVGPMLFSYVVKVLCNERSQFKQKGSFKPANIIIEIRHNKTLEKTLSR